MPSSLSQLSFMLIAYLEQLNSHTSDLCLTAALKSCYDRFTSMFSCASYSCRHCHEGFCELGGELHLKVLHIFFINCSMMEPKFGVVFSKVQFAKAVLLFVATKKKW